MGIFIFAAFVFLTYDCFVEQRQRLVMRNALRSGAIVSSMFPKEIQQRIEEEMERQKKLQPSKSRYLSRNHRIKSFLKDGDDADDEIDDAKPLADLFPDTSVLVSMGNESM